MNKNFTRLLIGSGENSPEIRYLTGISTPDDFICIEHDSTVTALMSKLEISRARQAAKPGVAVLPESDYGTTRSEIIAKIAEVLKTECFEVPPSFPLGLAEKLLELQPSCKIVFCTGYEEYAVSAFQLHVSGYLMKPITPEAVQKEIDHIKGVKATEKLLTIKCFGNFEVTYNGVMLPFKRKKAKELLAVLIDRNGAGMTAKQICAILFPEDTDDTKNAAYLRQLVLDLKNTLKTIRAEDILQHDTPYYRIDTNLVRCDYLSFLETGKPEFHGEYMTQYSWAEETCAMLQFKK